MRDTNDHRRRGTSLEHAILAAAWQELLENGFGEFTLAKVAKRAGTSRPVLARRWRNRGELVVAAIDHYRALHPIIVEDVGSLNDELASFLRQISDRGAPTAHLITYGLLNYFEATHSAYADLQKKLHATSPLAPILDRAITRGEIDPRKLTDRLVQVPIDLVRHETFKLRRPVSDAFIAEIIDSVFLPLVRKRP
jgi:AcrR family transcriptional regulator